MIRNYIVTSYRFIVKSKTYTILNLSGLVAGLTASFILLIFTINELSYDRYHTNEKRIYRVLPRDVKNNLYALGPYNMGPLLGQNFAGVESTARIVCPAFITGSVLVRSADVFREEPSFYCADPEIFTIFDIPLLRGDPGKCLDGNSSVIISDEAAQRYYGPSDPVGQKIMIRTAGITHELKVTGVFRAFPWNSSFQMDFIAGMKVFPMILGSLIGTEELASALNTTAIFETFILLKPTVSIGTIQGQVPFFISRSPEYPSANPVSFQLLRDMYMGSANINDTVHKKGNRSTMYTYLLLALFVLLLAGINYSILSTARSALRYKEIGVRKVMGATRRALSGQVLTESVLLTFLSFPVSYLLIGLSEPLLDAVFGYHVDVYSAEILILIPLFAGVTILIGLLSGAYIAFYLSSLNPIDALKNKTVSHKKINLSRVFTVFQLLITLSLLIAVLTIYLQVNFCITSDTGINKSNLAVISIDPNEFASYFELKNQVAALPEVISVSGSSIIPPDVAIPTITTKSAGSGKTITLESINVDVGFFKTMGIRILSGTDFDPADSMKSRHAYILNKEAVKILNFKGGGSNATFGGLPVIAIVSDFNVHTMYDRINPTIFTYRPMYIRALIIRYREGSWNSFSSGVEKIWKRLAPGQEFDIRQFSGEVTNLYKKERTFGYMVGAFTILALIIMGMGLFGLALLISERKTKETAIRKVFGATNTDILFGMQKEFLIYIAIASAIAIPVTTFFLRIWLDTFYYRIGLSWWIFVISVTAVTIFVSTIILNRTLRVLRENPVKALKYE